jgi:lysozyme
MEISGNGLDILIGFEGFVSIPYKDSIGVWTIGYGTTILPSGKRVTASHPQIDKAQALVYKKYHFTKHVYPAIQKRFKNIAIAQQEFDAICCLVYNCGPACLTYKWSYAMVDNFGKYWSKAMTKRVVDSWMSIDKAGGKTLVGLTRRRMTEVIHFFTGQTVYYISGSAEGEKELYKDYERHSGEYVYRRLGLI